VPAVWQRGLYFERARAFNLQRMKKMTNILCSVLLAVLCVGAMAADKPDCAKTGKNCPMNDGKACKCGKDCGC
jgi:hypothetical protein